MHIPDGFLAPQAWAPAAAVSATALAASLSKAKKHLDDRDVPLIGVTSAFIFAVQMLNFPVAAGASGHFMGATLASVVLGPFVATLVMTVVLVVQCLVFLDGGLLALGANVLNMGVLSVWAGWLAYRLLDRSGSGPGSPARRRFAVMVASWLSIVAAAAAASLELALSGTVALKAVLVPMLVYHALIGIGEGLITIAVLEMASKLKGGLRRDGRTFQSK